MSIDRKSINLPNLVSLIRILIAPILFYLALHNMQFWFMALLLFSGFTDVLDGFLARSLNQVTKLGSLLDSWGDFTIYSSMAICAWILWPDIVLQEMTYFVLIVCSFCVPVLAGLLKFKTLTSYHTWSVKFAVVCMFFAYILLFSGFAEWPFRAAAFICLYAGLEEIMITLLMQHPRRDIRSIWSVIKRQKPAA